MQLTSLVGHCFAAGSQTCDSESAIYVGGSGEVRLRNFSVDLIKLGNSMALNACELMRFDYGFAFIYLFDEKYQQNC